jgi:YHS domain-containing protein
MSWLAQNWVWVVLGVAIAWFAFRGRLGHAGGHSGLLGGMGHGGHASHGAAHGDHGGQPDTRSAASAPEAAVDPVSGEAVRTAQALTSVYQGKIYYFASKENRDRFEAAPQEYAHKAAGHALPPAEAASERPRRRRGC